MPDFQHRQRIAVPPDRLYAFVSDVTSLPTHVSTSSAQPRPGGKVRVQGTAQGHDYDNDGFFRADEAARRIEWGSDERGDSGFLETAAAGDGGSDLTVHLSFTAKMPERVQAEQQAKPEDGTPSGDGPG